LCSTFSSSFLISILLDFFFALLISNFGAKDAKINTISWKNQQFFSVK